MARKWLNLFAGRHSLSLLLAYTGSEGKITVFAAASLTNASRTLLRSIKKKKAWMWFLLSLRHLLSPVRLKRVRLRNLFISADQKWMGYAVDKKRSIPATRSDTGSAIAWSL